jgi:hypothetical protein
VDEIRPQSRRAVLAASLGALAALAGQALGRPTGARAATDDPLLLGHLDNSTPDPTKLTSNVYGTVLSVEHTGSEGGAIFALSLGSGRPGSAIQASAGGGSPGVYGASSTSFGVLGETGAGSGGGAGGAGVFGFSPGGRTGVAGVVGTHGDQDTAVAPASTGVWGRSNQTSNSRGVAGESTAGTGVWGTSASGKGVLGFTDTGTAVRAISNTGSAVSASTTDGTAFLGVSTNGKGGSLSNSSTSQPGLLVQAKGLTTAIEGYSGASATPPAQKPQTGVFGYANSSSASTGVIGETRQGAGVVGFAGAPANAAPDRNLSGVYGYAEGSTSGIAAVGVWGDSSDGYGTVGSGPVGVLATGGTYGAIAYAPATGVAVYAVAGNSAGPTPVAGTGVLAAAEGTAPALDVRGVLKLSRSGAKTISSGSSTTITGVALTASSIVLAQLQTNRSGVWVRAVVTNPGASSFTIYLNTSVAASTKLAWMAIG